MTTYALSPTQAGAIAARGRRLLRKRLITAHQAALLDALLWSGGRRAGQGLLTASLAVLARLAGQARSTTTQGIKRLEELGLIQRIRRRARVMWLGGATASRQIANAYRLLPADTETGARPARNKASIFILETPPAMVETVQRQLADIARERLRKLGLDLL